MQHLLGSLEIKLCNSLTYICIFFISVITCEYDRNCCSIRSRNLKCCQVFSFPVMQDTPYDLISSRIQGFNRSSELSNIPRMCRSHILANEKRRHATTIFVRLLNYMTGCRADHGTKKWSYEQFNDVTILTLYNAATPKHGRRFT